MQIVMRRTNLTKKFHVFWLSLTLCCRGPTVPNRFLQQQPLCLLETVCVMLWREVKKAPINWIIPSFVSYHGLNLEKWSQSGPQPYHKTQPFLLADQIANSNSNWKCAMSPRRNLCAWKTPKLKPLSIHNHVAHYLINQHSGLAEASRLVS